MSPTSPRSFVRTVRRRAVIHDLLCIGNVDLFRKIAHGGLFRVGKRAEIGLLRFHLGGRGGDLLRGRFFNGGLSGCRGVGVERKGGNGAGLIVHFLHPF